MLSLSFSIGQFIEVFGKLNGVRQPDKHHKNLKKMDALQHQMFVKLLYN